MSTLDRIKEELGWLKAVFVVFAAIDVSLIAWVAQHYETASPMALIFGVVSASCTTIVLVLVNRAALRRFQQLEDL